MGILHFPRKAGQSPALTLFRCNGCRVAFQPTRGELDYCVKCAAGRRLFGAAREWVHAFRPGAR